VNVSPSWKCWEEGSIPLRFTLPSIRGTRCRTFKLLIILYPCIVTCVSSVQHCMPVFLKLNISPTWKRLQTGRIPWTW
jgi:hypothetical protein